MTLRGCGGVGADATGTESPGGGQSAVSSEQSTQAPSCPACGSLDVQVGLFCKDDGELQQVACNDCGLAGPGREDVEAAWAAWHATANLRTERERVIEALSAYYVRGMSYGDVAPYVRNLAVGRQTAEAEVERLDALLQRERWLCERCGGSGQQPAGCWTGTAYDSEAGKCQPCGGSGYLGLKENERLRGALQTAGEIIGQGCELDVLPIIEEALGHTVGDGDGDAAAVEHGGTEGTENG